MSATYTMVYKGGRIKKVFKGVSCFYNINYAEKLLKVKGFEYEDHPLEKIIFYPTPNANLCYGVIDNYYIHLKEMWKGILEFKDFPDALCNGIHISAHHPRDLVLAALSTCRSPTERPSVPVIFNALKFFPGLTNGDKFLLAQMFVVPTGQYNNIGTLNIREIRDTMFPTAHTPTHSIRLSTKIFKKFKEEFPFKSDCKSLSEEPKIEGIQDWFSCGTHTPDDRNRVSLYMVRNSISTLSDLIESLKKDELVR